MNRTHAGTLDCIYSTAYKKLTTFVQNSRTHLIIMKMSLLLIGRRRETTKQKAKKKQKKEKSESMFALISNVPEAFYYDRLLLSSQ